MNWEGFIDWKEILLVVAFVAAFYFERGRYTRKMLRRLREQGLGAEAIRPRPRGWYRFRAILVLLAAEIGSYPLIQWMFPDVRINISSLSSALMLGGAFLFGALLYGRWLGSRWFDIADEAYREAKARESEQHDKKTRY